MTISGAYTQSFSLSLTYTSVRVNLSQDRAADAPAVSGSTQPVTSPSVDTIQLSPEAVSSADLAATTPAPAEPQATGVPVVDQPATGETAPAQPAGEPSRAAQRAEALLAALDADRDGSITKEEFTEGATALLRRAGARHHHRHVQGEHEDGPGRHEHRGWGHLERRLERLFDRVDESSDGSIDAGELTSALAQVGAERSAPPLPDAPAEAVKPEACAAAVSYTSVTVVVAVQQYTAISAMR